jgi:hypothetical protein
MSNLNVFVSPNDPKYAEILEKRQCQGGTTIDGILYPTFSKHEQTKKLPQWKLKRGIDKAFHKFSSTRERLQQKLEERRNKEQAFEPPEPSWTAEELARK